MDEKTTFIIKGFPSIPSLEDFALGDLNALA